MVGTVESFIRVRRADQHETARSPVQKLRHVLPHHHRRNLRHIFLAHNFIGDAFHHPCTGRRIDRRRYATLHLELEAGPKRLADTRANLVKAPQKQIAHRRLKAPDRSLKHRPLGNHIAGVSALKGGYRDNRSIRRIGIAGHNRLQRHDQLTCDKRRVDRVMRRRAVAPLAMDRQRKHVRRRPQRPRLHDDLIVRKPAPQMQTIRRSRSWRIERAVLDHRHRAAQPLLRRLKNQLDPPRQFVAMPRQQLRHTHPDCSVPVVPACVHHPRILRSKRQLRLLVNRQRVHVEAQQHRLALFRQSVWLHHRHDARLAHARAHLKPQLLQMRRHDPGRPHLLKSQLRMPVKVPPPLHKLRKQLVSFSSNPLSHDSLSRLPPCIPRTARKIPKRPTTLRGPIVTVAPTISTCAPEAGRIPIPGRPSHTSGSRSTRRDSLSPFWQRTPRL